MKGDLKKTGDCGKLIRFSLPFFASYFMQAFYGLTDLFVVGLYNPVSSTAAVATGTQVLHLITTVAVSLAVGCADAIKREYDKGDRDSVERTIGATIATYGLFALVTAVVLNLLVPALAAVLNVPSAALDGTKRYLHTAFLALPFVAITNLAHSTFRGLGHHKTPMYILLSACILNIILDFVFIGKLGLGAHGAAFATLLCQVYNSVVVVAALHFFLKKRGMQVSLRRLKLNRDSVRPITEVGVPIAVHDLFIQISFLFVTAIINRRGLTDSAAAGIVEKILSFILLFFSSIASSVTVLSMYESGEDKGERCRQYLYSGLLVAVLFALVVTALVELFPSELVSLFTDDPAVIKNGTKYITGYIVGLVFASVHYVFTGYFNSVGLTGVSYMHNIISGVFMRIPGVYLLSILFPRNLFPVGLASASGAVFSAIICVLVYSYVRAVRNRRGGASPKRPLWQGMVDR